MKKQTAVDFIIEKLAENGVLHSSDIWMAKSIEKAQIEYAFYQRDLDEFGDEIEFEQYYNETFKS